jgi:hypothetical protein
LGDRFVAHPQGAPWGWATRSTKEFSNGTSGENYSGINSRALFLARLSPDAWENFFKILDRALGLSVVARPGRESAVAHGAQFPAERLLGDRDAEFLEDPLRQIDQPLADNIVHWMTYRIFRK